MRSKVWGFDCSFWKTSIGMLMSSIEHSRLACLSSSVRFSSSSASKACGFAGRWWLPVCGFETRLLPPANPEKKPENLRFHVAGLHGELSASFGARVGFLLSADVEGERPWSCSWFGSTPVRAAVLTSSSLLIISSSAFFTTRSEAAIWFSTTFAGEIFRFDSSSVKRAVRHATLGSAAPALISVWPRSPAGPAICPEWTDPPFWRVPSGAVNRWKPSHLPFFFQ